MNNYRVILVITVLLMLISTGCIVVKRDKPEIVEVTPPQYTKQSKIDTGNKVVFTKDDDLVLQLPNEWVLQRVPSDKENVQSIATDSEKTLYLIITEEGKSDVNWQDIDKDVIVEVGNFVMAKRIANGTAVQTKPPEAKRIQDIFYSEFRTSTTAGAIESRNGVLISRSQTIYSISLIPVNDIMNRMPTPAEIDDIFDDIMATILI